MNATKKLLLLTVLLAPCSAFANEGAHIDGYYIPSSRLEVEGHVDGDGFGGKAMVPFGASQSFFIEGEYQSVDFDHNSGSLDQTRVGGGWQTPLATGTLGLYGEYVNLDLGDGDNADGLGVHARLSFPIAPAVLLFGQLGYVSVEDDFNQDIDGVEFLVGGSVDFTPNVGAFIDYRQSDLNADGGTDITLKDLRVGVRILFGI